MLKPAQFPALLTFNAHEVLYDQLRKFAKNKPMAEAAREILHHYSAVQRSGRVTALAELPKPDLTTRPGLLRTKTISFCVTDACINVLAAKAATTPLAIPTKHRTQSEASDIARMILESSLLSPADRTNMRTRASQRISRTRVKLVSVGIHLSAVTSNRLNTLLKDATLSRSFYLSLLVEDAVNGTNKAARALAMPASQQPARQTARALAALG